MKLSKSPQYRTLDLAGVKVTLFAQSSELLATLISSNLFCYPSPSGTDELSQFPTGWLGDRQTKSNILPYNKSNKL